MIKHMLWIVLFVSFVHEIAAMHSPFGDMMEMGIYPPRMPERPAKTERDLFEEAWDRGDELKALAYSDAALTTPYDINQTLVKAVLHPMPKIVQKALALGADPNQAVNGIMLIGIAADRGNVAIGQLLIEAGADVNKRGAPHSEWPLMTAVHSNNGAMVTLLLEHQADPKRKDSENKDALYYAIARGNEAIARALILHGALSDCMEDEIAALREKARERGYINVERLLDRVDCPSGELRLGH